MTGVVTTQTSFLEIRLLEAFRVVVGQRVLVERDWTRRKAKTLLKLLALEPSHQMHREQLIDLMWPELDLDLAAGNLHKIVHAVRRALEPQLRVGGESRFIVASGQQLKLSSPHVLSIDVEIFERLSAAALKTGSPEAYEAAIAQYRGDLLLEDLYEDWAAAPRERLRSTYRKLLTRVAEIYASLGEVDRRIDCVRRLLASDPSNEEAHRALMQAYAASGKRSEAMHQYKLCRDSLRSELDAEPDETTVALARTIIAGETFPLAPSSHSKLTVEVTRGPLAVLPLVNESADLELEYLSDGIAENLINSLSRLPQLRVMARSTAFRYKGREFDPRELSRDLGVRTALVGQVFKLGDRLVIKVELVDASDGTCLWGEQYRTRLTDIFAVQDEISGRISEMLKLQLTVAQKKQVYKRYTEDAEAYQEYLRGLYAWNQRTEEGLARSVEYFEKAILKDPDYALAYAGLANSYNVLGIYGALPADEVFLKVKASADRALELDETLAEAYLALAHIYSGYLRDWIGAERQWKKAVELNPHNPLVHQWYSEFLAAMSRFEESFAETKVALDLDPLSLSANTAAGHNYYYARQYDEAIEYYRKALELEPEFVQAHFSLGRVFKQLEKFDDAIAHHERALNLCEGSAEMAALEHAYRLAGKKNEAAGMREKLEKMTSSVYVSPYYLAISCASAGNKDSAFNLLERAYEERASLMVFLNVEPMFDPLRSDPRFDDLLRRMGFK
jgi:DNA-binding SARP family transcriptional activator